MVSVTGRFRPKKVARELVSYWKESAFERANRCRCVVFLLTFAEVAGDFSVLRQGFALAETKPFIFRDYQPKTAIFTNSL